MRCWYIAAAWVVAHCAKRLGEKKRHQAAKSVETKTVRPASHYNLRPRPHQCLFIYIYISQTVGVHMSWGMCTLEKLPLKKTLSHAGDVCKKNNRYVDTICIHNLINYSPTLLALHRPRVPIECPAAFKRWSVSMSLTWCLRGAKKAPSPLFHWDFGEAVMILQGSHGAFVAMRYTPATLEDYKQRFGNKADYSELGSWPKLGKPRPEAAASELDKGLRAKQRREVAR